MDNISKLVGAISGLITSLAWPLVVCLIVLRLIPSLKIFLERTQEISFKAGGVEATARVEAAAALGAALASSSAAAGNKGKDQDIAGEAASVVNAFASRNISEAVRRSRVLWVDDNPDNNVYERQALASMGIDFDLSISTEDALSKVRAGKYDLIISDMQRPPDMKAGYTLLSRLEANHPPYIIYRSSLVHEDTIEAKAKGATGITNKPADLFKMVLEIIGRVDEPDWRSRARRLSRISGRAA